MSSTPKISYIRILTLFFIFPTHTVEARDDNSELLRTGNTQCEAIENLCNKVFCPETSNREKLVILDNLQVVAEKFYSLKTDIHKWSKDFNGSEVDKLQKKIEELEVLLANQDLQTALQYNDFELRDLDNQLSNLKTELVQALKAKPYHEKSSELLSLEKRLDNISFTFYAINNNRDRFADFLKHGSLVTTTENVFDSFFIKKLLLSKLVNKIEIMFPIPGLSDPIRMEFERTEEGYYRCEPYSLRWMPREKKFLGLYDHAMHKFKEFSHRYIRIKLENDRWVYEIHPDTLDGRYIMGMYYAKYEQDKSKSWFRNIIKYFSWFTGSENEFPVQFLWILHADRDQN